MSDAAVKEYPEFFLEEEYVNTIPQKRAATPSEVAQSIVWLCSDDACYITGHNLVVDGGASI